MTATSPLLRLQELLPQLFTSTQISGDRYLRFQLTTEISALLSMEYVQESLLVSSEQITPIPNMSGSVMGLMSSRDRVFCVIDLAQLVGMTPLSAYARQYHLVVVRVSELLKKQDSTEQELFLGIAISRVQGISRVTSDQMQSLDERMQGNFPESLKPYFHGSVVEKQQPLLILNLETLVKKSLEQEGIG